MPTNPDSSTRYRKFADTFPTEEGKLPNPGIPNVKTIVLDWLSYSLKRFSLKKPIHLLGDYPAEVLMGQTMTPDGKISFTYSRGISVVLLDSNVSHKAIGNVIQTETLDDFPGNSETQYGWIERASVEVTYWSLDSRDRDNGAELTKKLLFEGFVSQHFLKNGLVEFSMETGYDQATDRIIANSHLYMHVMRFRVTRVFFATLSPEETAVYIQAIEGEGSSGFSGNNALGEYQVVKREKAPELPSPIGMQIIPPTPLQKSRADLSGVCYN